MTSDSVSSGAPTPGQEPRTSPPKTYLVWAILTTIFCCMPFGIVSIIYAARVHAVWAAGNLEAARSASANAKRWAIVSAVVQVVGVILMIAFYAIFYGLGADLNPQ